MPQNPLQPKHDRSLPWPSYLDPWICALVLFLIYWPTRYFGFTNWDDDEYVTRNSLITSLDKEHVYALFSGFHYLMYIPLTLLTYALEHATFGLEPSVYHLTNAGLHAANTAWVYKIGRQLGWSRPAAVLGALIFGIHPLRVESVAWVSERKDVLFVFFLLLGIQSWLKYIQTNKWSFYILTILAIVLSGLSKASAVIIFPFIIVIDYYLNRSINKQTLLEKVPIMALCIGIGYVQLLGIQSAVESQQDATGYSDFENLLILGWSYLFYGIKFIFPWPLSAYYPLPDRIKEGLSWYYYVSPMGVLAIIALVVYLHKRGERLWVWAIAWFSAGVFLFLKLRAGGFFLAGDRYTYAASIALSLALGHWIVNHKLPVMKWVGVFLLGVYLLLTLQQQQIWKSSRTLFSDVIRQYPDFYMAYINLGTAYEAEKNLPAALNCYQRSIEIHPNNDQAWYNAGNVLMAMEKPAEAVPVFRQAVTVKPRFAQAWNNLGGAWYRTQQWDSAAYAYRKAIELQSDYLSAWSNLAQAELQLGNLSAAQQAVDRAKLLAPNDPDQVLVEIAICEKNPQDFKCCLQYDSLLIKHPRLVAAWIARGGCYYRMGRKDLALESCDKALAIDPNFAEAWFNKGVILYEQQGAQAASPLFKKAASLGHPQAKALVGGGS